MRSAGPSDTSAAKQEVQGKGQDGIGPHTIYALTCIPTGRVYIGRTKVPLARRVAQHKNTPNKKMRDDVRRYQPFEDHFRIEVLQVVRTEIEAVRAEAHHIETRQARGPNGYNTLPGTPSHSRMYPFLIGRSRRNVVPPVALQVVDLT